MICEKYVCSTFLFNIKHFDRVENWDYVCCILVYFVLHVFWLNVMCFLVPLVSIFTEVEANYHQHRLWCFHHIYESDLCFHKHVSWLCSPLYWRRFSGADIMLKWSENICWYLCKYVLLLFRDLIKSNTKIFWKWNNISRRRKTASELIVNHSSKFYFIWKY